MSLRIALAQLNLFVGDVGGNTQRVIDTAADARDRLKADLVLFPELALSGYPPEDLLFHKGMKRQVAAALERVRSEVKGVTVMVGYPDYADDAIYNAAALIRDGKVLANYHKQELPNYSVFDEKRYFKPGQESSVVELNGIRVGLLICEDVWEPKPARAAHAAGAQLLVVINGSPYSLQLSAASRRHRARTRQGHGSAGRVCESARRPGRAHLRRRLLRDECSGRSRAARDAVQGRALRSRYRSGRRQGRAATRVTSSRSCPRKRASTTRSCSACATTWASIASPASCSVCRAASTRRCFLKKSEMNEKDVQTIYTGGTADSYRALTTNRVVGTILTPPFDDKAVSLGYKKFLQLGELADIPYVGLVTSQNELKTNRESVRRTVNAVIESVAWLRANRGESVKMIVDKFKVNQQEADGTYATLIKILNKDSRMNLKVARGYLDILRQERPIAADYDPMKHTDFSLLPRS